MSKICLTANCHFDTIDSQGSTCMPYACTFSIPFTNINSKFCYSCQLFFISLKRHVHTVGIKTLESMLIVNPQLEKVKLSAKVPIISSCLVRKTEFSICHL